MERHWLKHSCRALLVIKYPCAGEQISLCVGKGLDAVKSGRVALPATAHVGCCPWLPWRAGMWSMPETDLAGGLWQAMQEA